MAPYKKILAAVHLDPQLGRPVLRRACALASGSILSVVHAVEHVNAYGAAQAYPEVIELEERMLKAARKQLEELFEECQGVVKNLYTEVASPKLFILEKIKETKPDLVVIGDRQGLHDGVFGTLFGSTITAVIHHSPCDVLIVRIPKAKEDRPSSGV